MSWQMQQTTLEHFRRQYTGNTRIPPMRNRHDNVMKLLDQNQITLMDHVSVVRGNNLVTPNSSWISTGMGGNFKSEPKGPKKLRCWHLFHKTKNICPGAGRASFPMWKKTKCLSAAFAWNITFFLGLVPRFQTFRPRSQILLFYSDLLRVDFSFSTWISKGYNGSCCIRNVEMVMSAALQTRVCIIGHFSNFTNSGFDDWKQKVKTIF